MRRAPPRVGRRAPLAHGSEFFIDDGLGLLSGYLARTRYGRVAPLIVGDVLDIGCQHGLLKEQFADRIDSYVGIDIDEDAVRIARERHPECEFHRLDLDEEDLPFDARFDTIVMIAVIEHVFNLKRLAKGIARSLRPGGRLLLTTPTPFGNDVVHRIGSRLGLFSRVAADDHIVIFNRKRLDIFATEVGLSLLQHRTFQLGCNQLAVIERQQLADGRTPPEQAADGARHSSAGTGP